MSRATPNLTPAYVPQVGDRVRFTAEGVVLDLGNLGIEVEFYGGCVRNYIEYVTGTWERLPNPLPTTPGSVVQDDDFGDIYLRVPSGWYGSSGAFYPSLDDLVPKMTVLLDGGVKL